MIYYLHDIKKNKYYMIIYKGFYTGRTHEEKEQITKEYFDNITNEELKKLRRY